jgi:hypothetical protein
MRQERDAVGGLSARETDSVIEGKRLVAFFFTSMVSACIKSFSMWEETRRK